MEYIKSRNNFLRKVISFDKKKGASEPRPFCGCWWWRTGWCRLQPSTRSTMMPLSLVPSAFSRPVDSANMQSQVAIYHALHCARPSPKKPKVAAKRWGGPPTAWGTRGLSGKTKLNRQQRTMRGHVTTTIRLQLTLREPPNILHTGMKTIFK